MKLAVIGLSASGKTTVFNAVTGAHRQTGDYSTAPGHVNVEVVKVHDERVPLLEETFQPKKIVLPSIEYMDLAGLFADTGSGRGHDAQLLATIREADALVKVIRAFESDRVPHLKGSVDPMRDLRDLDSEMLVADLDIAEKRIEKLESSVKRRTPDQEREKRELALLLRCREAMDQAQSLADLEFSEEEEKLLSGFLFLTEKPSVLVLNVGEDQIGDESIIEPFRGPAAEVIPMCATIEIELSDLEEDDRADFMADLGITELTGHKLIAASHKALDLHPFFTTAHDELGVWMVREGDNAVDAAGKIHTDMARGFIRAEVVSFDDLKELGSMKEAKAKGRARLEGKDYIVQDGDIITFRFNV